MNRNAQERFSMNPVNIDIPRSRMPMDPEVKLTANLGEIFPIGAPIEVIPGDTFESSLSFAIRMQSLVTAPFDNLHFDYYSFFVPMRLVWEHFKEFMGENTESAWIPQTEYTVPQLIFDGGAVPYSVADYFGIPTGVNDKIYANALPFRAFALIYNEWFRDENLIDPVDIYFDDSNYESLASDDSDYDDQTISLQFGCKLPIACKTRDFFTSALPSPQKGPDVTIGDPTHVYFGDVTDGASTIGEKYGLKIPSVVVNSGTADEPNYTRSTHGFINGGSQSISRITSTGNAFQPANWYVDFDFTVNQLRLAFQIQKLYEQQARGGSRYVETLKALYGVTAPDSSLQRPQYLGGKRVNLQINQILQTSETGSTPQGHVAGYSLTSAGANGSDYIHSFTEHGYIITVGCIRIDQHTYQQGLMPMWTRKSRLEYYTPVLSSIGEQPIKNQNIFAQGLTENEYLTGTGIDNEVFGYQEAWADYRYIPSMCVAEMRSNLNNSLDNWHFADYYDSTPYLSSEWIKEDKGLVDRVLAVTSAVSNQFFGDFKYKIKATRPMPLYSIPGLIDHH